MCLKFLERGYPDHLIDQHRLRACSIDRKDLLIPKIKETNKKPRIPFVSTFGPFSKQVANVIRKHWPLLKRGCPEVAEFQTPPILAYKRDRNLCDILVKNDNGPRHMTQTQRLLAPLKKGNFTCAHCSCCSNLVRGNSFTHPQTGQSFPIKARYTCSSTFVVYAIICPCGLYYIGETTMEARARINKQKSTIRLKQMDVPVAAHFVTKGHSVSQLRFKIIDGVPPLRRGGDRQKILFKKNIFWIFTLDTMAPKGLYLEYKIHGI